MTVQRQITADKAGLVAHLRERAAEHRGMAGSAPTQRQAAYEKGVAEGLELAARDVEATTFVASTDERVLLSVIERERDDCTTHDHEPHHNPDSLKLLRLSVQLRSGGHRGEDFPANQRDAVNERILEALKTGDTLTISGVPVPARDIQYWQWEDGPRHVVTGP